MLHIFQDLKFFKIKFYAAYFPRSRTEGPLGYDTSLLRTDLILQALFTRIKPNNKMKLNKY